jgi:uncharacterized protein (DUF1330 family)
MAPTVGRAGRHGDDLTGNRRASRRTAELRASLAHPEDTMTAYAVAHLRTVDQNAEIVDYLRRIDATLDPFGGGFVVHGTLPEVLEGEWPGFLVVIGFPDLDAARAWYGSPAYQEILPLRTRNADGVTLLVDGVPQGYRAAAYAEKLVDRSSARASGTPGR